MSPILVWRDARRQDDQGPLQRFQCTEQELKSVITPHGSSPSHPEMWQWQVQEYIRTIRLKGKQRWIHRVGLDSEGLAGFTETWEADAGALYDLGVAALACRHHSSDGAAALEMMKDMIEAVLTRCVELGSTGLVTIAGVVHEENRGSQRMCERAGLEPKGLTDDREMRYWSAEIPIPEPDV